MKQLTQKIKWIACIIIILQCHPLCISAQNITLMKGLNEIPYSEPPLDNGKDLSNWGYDSSCTVSSFPSKIVGRIYDDLQCTKFDIFNYEEYSDLSPDVYLKIKIPNSTNLLSALCFEGATPYNTEVMFTIDAQGNVIDTLEVKMRNSGLAIKEYRITKDLKIIISRLRITSSQPLLMTDPLPDEQTLTGYPPW